MDLSQQRDATPLVLPNRDESVRQLEHIPVGNPPFREERLQELIVDHPDILPVSEIEPAYAPLTCLGTGISTSSGFLDVLYVSPDGYPTLVETKMWDNPEARREVVGQIIEYAKDLSRWGFDDLDQAVRKADKTDAGGILERVRQQGHDIESSSFVDTLTKKFRRGEFLLLIVGNGIRENLESLTSYLQGTPNLHFSLRLIELALYRLEPERDWPLLVQPRVVARTSEVTRAVVDVQTSDDVEVTVDLPSEDEEESSGRQDLTEKAFYEQLAENTSRDLAEQVQALVEDITDLGPEKKWGSSSVSLRLPDPVDLDRHWTVVVLQTDGQFTLGWLNRVSEHGGYDPEIWKSYRDESASLTGTPPKPHGTEKGPIQALLRHREEYVDLVRKFVEKIRAEADNSEEDSSDPS